MAPSPLQKAGGWEKEGRLLFVELASRLDFARIGQSTILPQLKGRAV